VFGPAVATYTAALISDTAVPAWHEGHQEMPFVFASSALASAAGLGLLAAPVDESGPLVPLAVAGGLGEVGLTKLMSSRMGVVKETYEQGRPGRYVKAAEAATTAGVVLAATSGRSRLRRGLAGAALLAGSLLTRLGIFTAGIDSTVDPKYTVVPQRERLDAR
jgi:hypothetical protein